jgi:hypothetical protein
MPASVSLKPKDLGVTGKFNSITSYKNKLIEQINEKYNEVISAQGNSISNDTRKYLSDYFNYLIFLCNYFDSNQKSFPNFSSIKIKREDFNEIEVYGAEIFGPIYLLHTKGIEVNDSDKVDMPVSSTEPGIDFTVGDKKISVKKSTGVTNTLKPSEIVGNADFKNYCNRNSNLKKLFNIFEILDEESAIQGATEVVLENKLPNLDNQIIGILDYVKTVKNFDKNVESKIKSMMGNVSFNSMTDIMYKLSERAIEDWSKQPQNKDTLKDFANAYLRFSGLSLFTLSISKSTGAPEPKLASSVLSAIIKSKGKHASRINSKGKLVTSSEKMGVMFEKMNYA